MPELSRWGASRRDARVVERIAATTLRGWTTAVGVPANLVWPVIGGGYVLATAGSVLGALWLASSGLLAPFSQPEVAVLVLVMLVWINSFTGILAAASSANSTGSIRFLRTLPISDRTLGAGLAVPTLTASALQTCLLVPAMAMVLAEALGCGLAPAGILALAASVVGTLQGRLLFGVSRRFVLGHPRLPVAPHLLAVLLLIATMLLGLEVLIESMASAPTPLMALLALPLGWPAVAIWAVQGSWTGTILTLVTVGAFLAAECWCWPWLTAANDLRPIARVARPRLRSSTAFPLVRMQLVRMVRNERCRAILAALLVMEVVTLPAVLGVDGELRPRVLTNSVLLWSLMAGALPILARGISPRHRPFALTVGFPAFRWGSAVATGAVLLALACSALPLMVVAVVQAEPLLLAGGLGQALFVALLAATLGAVVTPSPGTGPAETLILAVVLAGDLVVTHLLGDVAGIDSDAGVGLAMGLVSLPLAVVPGLVEHWRWRLDTVGRIRTDRSRDRVPGPAGAR